MRAASHAHWSHIARKIIHPCHPERRSRSHAESRADVACAFADLRHRGSFIRTFRTNQDPMFDCDCWSGTIPAQSLGCYPDKGLSELSLGIGNRRLRSSRTSGPRNFPIRECPKTIGSRITDILLPLCYGRTESNHTVGTPGSVVRRACGFLVCGEQEVSHRSLCVRVP